jgi:hypothetical protein
MVEEILASLYSAQKARSVALLAFGSDSLVELLSGECGTVVISCQPLRSAKSVPSDGRG